MFPNPEETVFRIDLKAGLRERSRHNVELECLRGLAIWLVLLFHVYGVGFSRDEVSQGHAVPWPCAFIVAGRTGVTLFFVLSGFLLSLPYLRPGEGQRPSAKSFYLARALRVLPAYYAAILVAFLLTGEGSAALKALVFGFISLQMFPYSVVWWTLATEVQFYALLPPVMALAIHPRGRWVGVALAILWLGMYVTSLWVPPSDLGELIRPARNSLFGRAPAFAMGIGAAFWYVRGQPGTVVLKRLPWISSVAFISTVLLLGRLLAFAAEVGELGFNRHYHFFHTLEAVCWSVILMLFLVSRPFGSGVLLNSVFAFSGKISYSLYLIHLPVIFYLLYPATASGVDAVRISEVYLRSALAIVASFALAWIGFTCVELPFLRLKEKLPIFRRRAG